MENILLTLNLCISQLATNIFMDLLNKNLFLNLIYLLLLNLLLVIFLKMLFIHYLHLLHSLFFILNTKPIIYQVMFSMLPLIMKVQLLEDMQLHPNKI